MMKLMKNVTINGINYRLMGTAYVPTAPGLILEDNIGDYGFAHMKYLQMAHPDDFSRLQDSGLLQKYLARVGSIANLYIEDRLKYAPVPVVADSNFEQLYRRHNCVSHNAICKAENDYIFHGLHEDVLNSLTKEDTVSQERSANLEKIRDQQKKSVSFQKWLEQNPRDAEMIQNARALAHERYRQQMRIRSHKEDR